MNIIISNSDKRPIYEQIVAQIKSDIISDKLKTGDKIPSIRFLAKELKISVITTKRAYDELENEGFVTTVPGKGTFVAAKDEHFIKEEILKDIEIHFSEAITKGQLVNLTLDDLKDILENLCMEE